jgi:putative addiction module component (TIGR02574 family)
MPIPALPLDKMSTEEKLRTLEAIWENVSANPEDIESPAWHQKELRVREAQVASGEAKFVDWEKAKEEIRRQTS